MCFSLAFVYVCARPSIAFITIMTSAIICADVVSAECMLATVVCFYLTFILVYTLKPVAFKSVSTFAFISTNGVYTRCMSTAIMRPRFALVNILTGSSITMET